MHEFPISYSHTEWNLFSSAIILFCGDVPAIKTKLNKQTGDSVSPNQVAHGLFISICNTVSFVNKHQRRTEGWNIFGAQCSHSFIAVLVDELSKGISYPICDRSLLIFLAQDILGT